LREEEGALLREEEDVKKARLQQLADGLELFDEARQAVEQILSQPDVFMQNRSPAEQQEIEKNLNAVLESLAAATVLPHLPPES
jgi:hypothetical protein